MNCVRGSPDGGEADIMEKITESTHIHAGKSAKAIAKKAKSTDSSGESVSLNTAPIAARGVLKAARKAGGSLAMPRFFTKPGQDVFASFDYAKATSKIKDTDGKTVFEMKDVEVPAGWSQLAVDILVSKYFRKAGVPGTTHEVSVKQVVRRITRTIRKYGEANGYFDASGAQAFEDELSFLLLTQRGAFNSPVWFNLGLYAEYGIEGSGGNFFWDTEAQRIRETPTAYVHPQCSACFNQAVDDDIWAHIPGMKNEARLFKNGSGSGTNVSM
jgi:ribonucleoside-diphosphate reductase alpha chain